MISLVTASVSVPSSPIATSIRTFRSFRRDDQEHAIVLVLLADLPMASELIAVVFDRRALQRLQGHDDELIPSSSARGRRAARSARCASPRHEPSLVDDPPGQRRKAEGLRGTRADQTDPCDGGKDRALQQSRDRSELDLRRLLDVLGNRELLHGLVCPCRRWRPKSPPETSAIRYCRHATASM